MTNHTSILWHPSLLAQPVPSRDASRAILYLLISSSILNGRHIIHLRKGKESIGPGVKKQLLRDEKKAKGLTNYTEMLNAQYSVLES